MRWVSVTLLVVAVGCATAGKDPPPNPEQDAPVTIDDSPVSDIDAPVTSPDANTCATLPCDILTKCGCPGKACDLDTSDLNGTACRDIFQPVAEGNQCGNPTRCDAGFVCLFGSSGPSICKRWCGADADCGQPRGQCVIDINGATGIPSVCSSNCDPTNTAAGGCAAGTKCSLFTATKNAVVHDIVDCAAAGTGVQGAACTTNAAPDDTKCAANFLCTTAGTTACRRICNRAAPNCGGLTCIPFNPAFTIAGVEYGVCN